MQPVSWLQAVTLLLNTGPISIIGHLDRRTRENRVHNLITHEPNFSRLSAALKSSRTRGSAPTGNSTRVTFID